VSCTRGRAKEAPSRNESDTEQRERRARRCRPPKTAGNGANDRVSVRQPNRVARRVRESPQGTDRPETEIEIERLILNEVRLNEGGIRDASYDASVVALHRRASLESQQKFFVEPLNDAGPAWCWGLPELDAN
jgi:hypothetical protein